MDHPLWLIILSSLTCRMRFGYIRLRLYAKNQLTLRCLPAIGESASKLPNKPLRLRHSAGCGWFHIQTFCDDFEQMTDSHSIVESLLICLLIFCFRNSHHFREINALKSFGLRMVGSGISLCFSSMKMWHHNGYGWCFKTGAIPICHGRMLLNPPFVSWSADLDAKWSGLAPPDPLGSLFEERIVYSLSHRPWYL